LSVVQLLQVLQRMAQGHLRGHMAVGVLGHNLCEGVGSQWGFPFCKYRLYLSVLERIGSKL
jgi:hypothetical protein